jgi:hypothetical protein
MKITNKLPHFENKKILLIVSGGFKAVYYLAENDYINEISQVEEEQRHYSDREGFFQTSGSGEVFGSGAVYEEKKIEREKRFMKKVIEETNRINNESKIDAIYFYGPGHILGQISSHFPKDILGKFAEMFEGNYVQEHPFLLLSKIKKTQDKFKGKKVPLNEEARKILKKYNLINH